MKIDEFAVEAGKIVELAGVSVLIAGAMLAAAAFLIRLLCRRPFRDAYHELRADLGRAILLGLESLVIVDISARWRSSPPFRISACWRSSSPSAPCSASRWSSR